jgi:hypothetical protein
MGFQIKPACAKWSVLLYVESAPSGDVAAVIGHAGPPDNIGTPGGKAEAVTVVGGGAGFAEVSEKAKQINDWV